MRHGRYTAWARRSCPPTKEQIEVWLEAPYSAERILEKIREKGFGGGHSIVREYVRNKDMVVNAHHYRRLISKQSFDTENTLLDGDHTIDFPVQPHDLSRYDEVLL